MTPFILEGGFHMFLRNSVLKIETKASLKTFVITYQAARCYNPEHRNLNFHSHGQSQRYFTTGGLSPVSSSWQQAP
jgi:hypothetical protein